MSSELPVLPLSDGVPFVDRIAQPLRASDTLTKLQINLGLLCNIACRHCHVESSQRRTAANENMTAETANRVLEWIERYPQIDTIDLTGGSPEINPNFRHLVTQCRAWGRTVIDRCNPTLLVFNHPEWDESLEFDRQYDWVPSFLAEHQVQVVASLPCYLEENVRYQRGSKAYNASVEGLLLLNQHGYGRDPALKLNLVYNPNGAHLPPPQEKLAEDYHRELEQRFGIVFNELWTITNMPIKRWGAALQRWGQLEEYMQLLATAYQSANLEGLMCRHQIHVDSQGYLHDCDFNYALGARMPGFEQRRLWEVSLDELQERLIANGDHCYGCTAGAGSSCTGTLATP